MPDERSLAATPINRREFLEVGSALAGAATLASTALVAACGETTPKTGKADASAAVALTPEQVALLEEVADTILPTTPASPGAKAAGVGAIANLLLTDCYDAVAQGKVRAGLAAIAEQSEARAGGGYTKLSPSQREQLLRELDAEAKQQGAEHWFHVVREVASRAYFSSETGMTKALRWVRVPGRWEGCMPLQPGQPSWG